MRKKPGLELLTIPPLDERVPSTLQTATFGAG